MSLGAEEGSRSLGREDTTSKGKRRIASTAAEFVRDAEAGERATTGPQLLEEGRRCNLP